VVVVANVGAEVATIVVGIVDVIVVVLVVGTIEVCFENIQPLCYKCIKTGKVFCDYSTSLLNNYSAIHNLVQSQLG
jgi:hypothetical protein